MGAAARKKKVGTARSSRDRGIKDLPGGPSEASRGFEKGRKNCIETGMRIYVYMYMYA